MLSAEAMLRLADEPFTTFTLPPDLEAKEPAEVRGVGRDDVRLLVTARDRSATHARFQQLPQFLTSGDLVVLNTSATIPAALKVQCKDQPTARLHISTRLPSDLFVVEPRDMRTNTFERLRLPGGALAELLTPYRDSRRLWIARLYLPAPFLEYLTDYGRPIKYRHADRDWPPSTYQNVYAAQPGSAEMPSAGRPFTQKLLRQLREWEIGVASIVLHAGVSSLERGEPPYEEAYEVSTEAADAIRRARRHGGRIIAVGTTVVRALESSLDDNGRVVASRGWTDLVITPERGVHVVDGLLTGFHEPNSSHLAMLEAIAGRESIREAYLTALESRYLWHEFGDSHLILA
jgi:S-adenosylmethionine:tRNA ribosyltransferase-isomerase